MSRKLCYRATLGDDKFDLNKEKLDGVAPLVDDPPDPNSTDHADVAWVTPCQAHKSGFIDKFRKRINHS